MKRFVPASSGLFGGMYFIFLFCNLLVLVHIVIHAIGLGIDPASAANTLAIYGLVSIATVNIMGLAGDRFGNRPIFAISFLLLAISFSGCYQRRISGNFTYLRLF